MKIKHSTLDEFAEAVKKRKIYCFGSGKALINFLIEFSEYDFESRIEYIVDNSVDKQESLRQCPQKKIPIISPKKMLQLISQDDVLLITTLAWSDIVKQLEQYELLCNMDCYIYYFLKMEQDDYDRRHIKLPKDFATKEEICIPKIIHYCWFGKKEIPRQNRIWMESWKKYCSDYEIVEWNESNYDISKNLYMRQAYEKGKWAFVSDYARVDIISRYGGVYLDTDVELIKNLDPLLKNEAFCGFESSQYVAFGLGFGAVENHKIIKELRDEYETRKFVLDNGQLNQVTCPVYQTELLGRYGLKKNGQFQKLNGMTIYPERVLCGMSIYNGRVIENLEDTYSIHHYDGSWARDNQKVTREAMMKAYDEWKQ